MSKKPKVMIFGTFHLRYTPDLHRGEFEESLIRNQQKEIKRIVQGLKEFKPTKIAFEVVKEDNEALNEEYRRYLNGEMRYEVNEIHQFGFQTAAQLGHKEVYAVDWMESVGNLAMGQVYEWAKKEQPELYNRISKYYWPKLHTSYENFNIFDLVKELNTEERMKLVQEEFMLIAQIGKGTDYVGIDWLRWWYQRNLIIYSNLAKITNSPDDRTLLIIGGAHIHPVSQFIKESGMMDVVPALEYLK